MGSEMDSIVHDFLVESHENLDQLDRDLVALEGDSQPQQRLARIFRTIHTIKGTCGFLGFAKLEEISHVAENLLSRLRDGVLSPTPAVTTALLQLLDSIREILASIESTGQEGDLLYHDLIDTLTRLQSEVADTQPVCTSLTLGEVQTDKSAMASAVADTAIRVDVKLLDKLMNLVGELVLARNQIQQHANHLGDSHLMNSSQRLNLITIALQERVMKTRMQPIGNIWSKFPRVIRDLSQACGKQVSLEMDGIETELDKTLIEAVKDPLTHLVRNAIDHGIEPPEARIARGKPAVGHIWLRAFHDGGQVNIEITDDGRGISPEQIKTKAVERGLVTQEQAKVMNDRDAIRLIFLPGFSTAEQITNVSGRGVGLDVVRANIERIGGVIDVHSKSGGGTTIRIKIPLTLAIVPALMVGNAAARFAIPQINLLELVRLEGDDARNGIELAHGAPVYRLRGNLLPLVYLNRELQIQDAVQPGDPQVVNIVVLQAEDRRFGLVVDNIFDSAEIVVKPLDKRLHRIRAFAGATILGDGKLALILNVVHIAKTARLLSDSPLRLLEDSSGTEVESRPCESHSSASRRTECRQTLLVFQADNGGRMAIPLSLITRLEEIPRSQIEKVGAEWVVQYRGQILPLVDSAKALGGAPSIRFTLDDASAARQAVPVVVCTGDSQPCGLIVERILDIVEEDLNVRGKTTRPGIDYTAVVQGRVTEIVNIATLLRIAAPNQALDVAT